MSLFTGMAFEEDTPDLDERNVGPTTSALKTNSANDVQRADPKSFETLPSTETLDSAFEVVDWTMKRTFLDEADAPDAKRIFTFGWCRK